MGIRTTYIALPTIPGRIPDIEYRIRINSLCYDIHEEYLLHQAIFRSLLRSQYTHYMLSKQPSVRYRYLLPQINARARRKSWKWYL